MSYQASSGKVDEIIAQQIHLNVGFWLLHKIPVSQSASVKILLNLVANKHSLGLCRQENM